LRASKFKNEIWRLSGIFILIAFLSVPFSAYDITGSMFGAIIIACILIACFAAVLFTNEDDQFQGVWGTVAGKKPLDEFIEFNGLIEISDTKNKAKLYLSSLLTILSCILTVIYQEVWIFNITIFLFGASLNNIASSNYSTPSKDL